MPLSEKRLLGVIVDYMPCSQQGIIADVETQEELPFFCKYVRSDVLRRKLAQTDRFTENVFIQPNIYVAYTRCKLANADVAARIEPVEALPPEKDYGAPLVGYIQFFGPSNAGHGGYSGWINAQIDSDEHGSAWFDLTNVIDPVLKEHLIKYSHLRRGEWMEQNLKVRYWKVNKGRATPSCTHIALADNTVRQRMLNRYALSETNQGEWTEKCWESLQAKEDAYCPEYAELPMQPEALTMDETKMLEAFRKEAMRTTASNPAQRGQLNALWKLVGRCQTEALTNELDRLPNIKGTRLALLCHAACCYLDREYASAIQLCCHAQRNDFAAQLAIEMGEYAVAQRIAELALNEDPNESRIHLLTKAAVHTGNAHGFCEAFQEMIEACEYGDEAAEADCDTFMESAMSLLERLDIDCEDMDALESCCAVREHYATPVLPLDRLLAQMNQKEQVQEVPVVITVPANRLIEPPYYTDVPDVAPVAGRPSAQGQVKKNVISTDGFKQRFMENNCYRLPDLQKDRDAIPMLDELLAAELASVNDYRMPMLMKICLDAQSSAPQIQKYIDRLEQFIDKKPSSRGRYERDRRWRLFKALLAYVQSTDDVTRTDAWIKANNEAQDNEKALINSLPH